MSLSFEQPMWLLAALAGVPLAWMGLAWFMSMSRVRRWSAVVLRVVLIGLIAGMLAGASGVRTTDSIAVVGVIDISGSVRRFADAGVDGLGRRLDPVEAARAFLVQAARDRGPDDRMGLVVFDGRSLAVATPTRADIAERALDVSMVEGTDIAGALRYAAALLPGDASGRIVLMSDGNETAGDAGLAARELGAGTARAGVPVDVVPFAYNVSREAMIESVDAPPRAASEANITVRVALFSTDGIAGTLQLVAEGEPVDINGDLPGTGRRLDLPPGRHVELITVGLEPRRIHRFKAVLEPDTVSTAGGAATLVNDTRLENNEGESFTITPGKGSVLLVDGVSDGAPDGPGSSVARVLRRAGIDVTTVAASAVPASLLEMQAYDLVMLQNVPVESVTPERQEVLAAYVRDWGGGLVMIGGPDSFGAGGWKGSAIEPLLPVSLDLPERLVQPDAAIVFVLDVSGSMGRSVMGSTLSQQEIANEAAALAVRSLDKKDLVGVIAFSENYDVIVPLAPNADPEATAARVLSLGPGGGTNMGPAMEEAERQLSAARAEVKHLIVLSDGRSLGYETLPDLAGRMHERHGITVSTISVGSQSDDVTMDSIATRGGGTFYPVSNPTLLPKFFLKAVRIVRTPMVRESPFEPRILPTGSPLTAGLGTPARLTGVNLTQARPEPTIVNAMSTPTGEPLLAHWNVELGQVAAFTSDAHDWARAWLDWEGYSTMWTSIARVISRSAGTGRFDLTTEISGDVLKIGLDAAGEDGRPLDLLTVPATVYDPNGGETEVTLSQTGPGLYAASVPARMSGNYVVLVKPRLGAQKLSPVIGGASLTSGVEFRRLRSNTALLRRIAETTGGRLLDLRRPDTAKLFDHSGVPPTEARVPLWRTLLIWAVLVMLLDVATRRIAWDRFVSKEFGVELRKIAAEAVGDRGERAAKATARLQKTGGRADALGGAAALSDADAEVVVEQAEERRRQAKIAAYRGAREGRGNPEPKAGAEEGGLKSAKRRARERFDDGKDA